MSDAVSAVDHFLKSGGIRRPIALSPQQLEAAARTEGQTLLLAVPGSGKTTVIICRLAYMIEKLAIAPESILTLTFSRSGAGDLLNRYRELCGKTFAEPRFSTIHSFALSVIRRYETMYRRKAFDVLEDSGRVIREIYHQIYHTWPSDSDMTDIESVLSLISNRMMTPAEIAEIKVGDLSIEKLYQAYGRYKRRAHLMDFDDMLVYAYKLLKKHRPLLKFFKERYRYLNLDEAQDTSTLQFAIIRLLTGKSGNLLVVGDEDQSIYGFRGASPKALLQFQKVYPKGQVLLMETNRRATAALVAAADRFIKLNKERYPKHMTTENPEGLKPVRRVLPSIEAQYAYLGTAVRQEGKHTAILYRNNDSAIPLIDRFEREHLRYRLKEHEPTFFSHFIVRDIADFFAFAHDLSNLELFRSLYYKMDCGISKTQMEMVCRARPQNSVFDALLDLPGVKDWMADKWIAEEKGLKKLAGMAPGPGVHFIVEELGYREHLAFRVRNGCREENVVQKLNILQILAGREATQEAFFDRLTDLKSLIAHHKTDPTGPVTLSTIHSSKGLEFDKVYLIDAVDGEFPSQSALEDSEEGRALYNEEVRLFYVGVTRAKKEVEIVSVKGRKESRFVPVYLGEKKKEKQKKAARKMPSLGAVQAAVKRRKALSHMREVSAKRAQRWHPGDHLVHTKFGAGEIQRIKGTLAEVAFSGQTRQIDLAVCEAKHLIRRV
jgi:DNA helicase-2/ATP-dependent DNA helicase PcrA